MSSSATITPVQRKALLAAWLGWAFDGLDGYLYVMVAPQFVRQLLTIPGEAAPTAADVGAKAAIIQAMFLVGWAVGGAFFGRMGDRIGRARTLTLTILTYAVFTGLSVFAQTWWHLMIFRFIAALGIGGEWAAGSALVSEMLHPRHRSWASATLQSGYMVGCILAALTSAAMSSLDPRFVFLVGVAPALLTLWIRRAVPEPDEWHKAALDKPLPAVSDLFKPGLAGTTLLTLALTSITLTTVWAFLFYAPQVVRATPEAKLWTPEQAQTQVMLVTITFLCVNIVANFAATYTARFFGYRAAFFLFIGGSLGTYWFGFRTQPDLAGVYMATGAAAFFGLGLFGMFPLYIPPLFPTLVRTLGAGFTYNVGRLVAAVGTFFTGSLAAHGPSEAIAWVGLLYIPGLVVALFIPTPRFNTEAR